MKLGINWRAWISISDVARNNLKGLFAPEDIDRRLEHQRTEPNPERRGAVARFNFTAALLQPREVMAVECVKGRPKKAESLKDTPVPVF